MADFSVISEVKLQARVIRRWRLLPCADGLGPSETRLETAVLPPAARLLPPPAQVSCGSPAAAVAPKPHLSLPAPRPLSAPQVPWTKRPL